MFSFLPVVPGADLRALARKVDTARHHGIPNGCILELDLQSTPAETSGFDPLVLINGAGKPLLLREAVEGLHRAAEDPRVAGLISRALERPGDLETLDAVRGEVEALCRRFPLYPARWDDDPA